MAHTINEFIYNGTQTDYDLSFSSGFRVRSNISAYKEGVPRVPLTFSWLTASRVRIVDTGLEQGDTIAFVRTVSKIESPINMLLPNNFTREAVVATVNHTLQALQEVLDGRVDSFNGEFINLIESYVEDLTNLLNETVSAKDDAALSALQSAASAVQAAAYAAIAEAAKNDATLVGIREAAEAARDEAVEAAGNSAQSATNANASAVSAEESAIAAAAAAGSAAGEVTEQLQEYVESAEDARDAAQLAAESVSVVTSFATAKSLLNSTALVSGAVAFARDGTEVLVATPNLIPNSENFAPWSKPQVPVTESTGLSPTGSRNASRFVPTAVLGNKTISQAVSGLVAGRVSASVYAKASGRSVIQIRWSGGAGGISNAYANFDLATGQFSVSNSDTTATMVAVGDGWYRCAAETLITGDRSSADTGVEIIDNLANPRRHPITPNGTDGLWLWGAQCQQGVTSVYQPTGVAPRRSKGTRVTGQKVISAKTQKWVIMADGQPANTFQRNRVVELIADIARKHPDAHSTIYAGDIAHRGNVPVDPSWWSGTPITYDMLLKDLEALPTGRQNTFYLAGNHDFNYGDRNNVEEWTWNEFLTWFDRLFYHVKIGNVLFIYMAPMARATAGHITDYVVAWWKELVRCHQDHIIVNVTHHPVQNTTAGSPSTGGSLIASSRFTSVLTSAKFKSDLWFSGHTGGNFNDPAVVGHGDFFNCHFVGVDMNSGAFDAGTGDPNYPASYVTMELTDGSDVIKMERHAVGVTAPAKIWSVPVKRPVQLSDAPAFDGRTQFDPKHGVIQGPVKQAYNLPKQLSGTTVQDPNRPVWVYEAILEDRLSQNVEAGSGGGFLVHVPGAAANGGADETGTELNRAFGVGAGWTAERNGNGDTDYSASFVIYASTTGQDYNSLVKVMSFRNDHVQLGFTDFAFRMSHSTAGENGINFSQSTGGVSMIVLPRGDGGTTGWNSGPSILNVGRTINSRSISTGGTINASGADYAEYREVQPHLYENVEKGAMLGTDASGLMTDKWSETCGRVLFKSTTPNLVGNDQWGTEESICAKYDLPEVGEAVDGETADDKIDRKNRAADVAVAWELERVKYDRMAFCGVVPTKVQATAEDIGKYVVPQEGDKDSIGYRLVSKRDLTLVDYIDSCGIVEGVKEGYAIVLVKIN